jgi:hypothetical protein
MKLSLVFLKSNSSAFPFNRLDQQANNRPLVMILSYLRAKENHLEKYAKLYFDHGFDALVFQVSPWRLFLPESVQVRSGIQMIF